LSPDPETPPPGGFFLARKEFPDADPRLPARPPQRALQLCRLGAVLTVLGWNLPQPLLADIVQAAAGLCAVLAFILKERGLLDDSANGRRG
jgi:hypothetical protein